MPHPTIRAVRDSNRRAVELLGNTPELTIDLSGVDEQPVLALSDLRVAGTPGTRLLLLRTCRTRDDALALLAAGAFDELLPTVLVDLGARELPVTVLRYDLVHGLQETARLDLPDPDSATADEIRSSLIAICDQLEHDDDVAPAQ